MASILVLDSRKYSLKAHGILQHVETCSPERGMKTFQRFKMLKQSIMAISHGFDKGHNWKRGKGAFSVPWGASRTGNGSLWLLYKPDSTWVSTNWWQCLRQSPFLLAGTQAKQWDKHHCPSKANDKGEAKLFWLHRTGLRVPVFSHLGADSHGT